MPCDFPLAVVFVTSTSGRFVKLSNLALISKYTTVPNLIKQLFHLRLLDMRLVIANSAIRASLAIREFKGPGKRGHIVADTLLPTQMFPRLPPRATLLPTQILCPGHKNVSDFVQKHFVSATNVSQFAQPKKHHG